MVTRVVLKGLFMLLPACHKLLRMGCRSSRKRGAERQLYPQATTTCPGAVDGLHHPPTRTLCQSLLSDTLPRNCIATRILACPPSPRP